MDEQNKQIDIERRLTETEARSKSNSHRIDELAKKQEDLSDLTATIATVKNEQGHIQSDVAEIKTDVKALTAKPGKHWDSMVDKLILVLVSAIAGFFLAKFGLS